MLWPNGTNTRPAISSPFGPRTGGAFSFHYGTDFVGFDLVRAVAGGRVTLAGWMNENAGITVAVDYAPGVTLVYMHLDSVSVRRGDVIRDGDPIGLMGDTGNADGRCAHVEVRLQGKSVDPVPWIAARLTAPAAAGSPAPTPVTTQEDITMDTRQILQTSSAGVKFELLRGTKRSIGVAEWTAMRALATAGGPKIVVATISAATLNAIPGR